MSKRKLRQRINEESSSVADDFEEKSCPEQFVQNLRDAEPEYLSDPRNIHKMISEVPEQFKEDLKEFKKKVKSWVDEYKASQQEGLQ